MDEELKKPKVFLETRSYPFQVSEIRTLENNTVQINGYAAVYNELSSDLGGFREKIKPGFFREAIDRDDVRALYNHDDNYVLGRTKSGTLILSEDKKGLPVSINPPNTTYARDLIVLMERGDVDQMSFQFETEEDSWDSTDLNSVIRTLVRIKRLWDVSIVTFPAYPQTKAEVNSAKQVYINYLEELLEDNSKRRNEKLKDKISIMRKKLLILEKEI